MKKNKLLRLFKITVIVYLLLGIALYFLQDFILFHPVSLKGNHQYEFPGKYKEINIPVDSASNLNIIQFYSTDTITRGVVLYFHGNKKNISWYAKYTPYFTKHGYDVWMIDYPGFGKSTGNFNERILYDWASLVYQFAAEKFSTDSIIIYGKSMGTGIASQLASVKPCKKLILETPYYSFPSLISSYLPIYPVDLMIHYKIPTWQYLQKIKVPVSIFQGTADWTVPLRNAKKLNPFLKNTDEFITIEGGSHNDLFTFRQTIQKLDSLLIN
jgi:uncharacterized protein